MVIWKKGKLALLALSILLLSATVTAAGTPTLAVNETTKECVLIDMGDECSRCESEQPWIALVHYEMPPGQEISQDLWSADCPEGYTQLEPNSVEALCSPVRSADCCTGQATGDCGNIYVNEAEKKCAFSEILEGCEKLPENWGQAPQDTCPSEQYAWIWEAPDCSASPNGGQPPANGSQPPSNGGSNPIPSQPQAQPDYTLLLGGAAVIIILIAVLAFTKKKK